MAVRILWPAAVPTQHPLAKVEAVPAVAIIAARCQIIEVGRYPITFVQNLMVMCPMMKDNLRKEIRTLVRLISENIVRKSTPARSDHRPHVRECVKNIV